MRGEKEKPSPGALRRAGGKPTNEKMPATGVIGKGVKAKGKKSKDC